jgi:hypothetical protein
MSFAWQCICRLFVGDRVASLLNFSWQSPLPGWVGVVVRNGISGNSSPSGVYIQAGRPHQSWVACQAAEERWVQRALIHSFTTFTDKPSGDRVPDAVNLTKYYALL